MSAARSVNCPVCACELGGPIEICTSCHTPHHADCARFVGRCSLFGCGAYEFMALDGAAAGFAVQTTSIELEQVPDEPDSGVVAGAPRSGAVGVPGAQRCLGRTIPARMLAAAQLLAQNPQVLIPVGALLFLCSLLPVLIPGGAGLVMALLHTVGWLLGQALIVIILVSRAQGKDPTLEQALAVANERCKRIVLTGLASCIMVGSAMAAGLVMTLAGLLSSSWLMTGAGSLLTLLGFKKFVSWSLVTIVAAMGLEDEPSNALARSTQLVALARTQAALSVIAFFFGAMFLSGLLPPLMRVLVTTSVGLLATAYWTLFYLETRRLHQATFLPFAPAGYLPDSRAQVAAVPAKVRAGSA